MLLARASQGSLSLSRSQPRCPLVTRPPPRPHPHPCPAALGSSPCPSLPLTRAQHSATPGPLHVLPPLPDALSSAQTLRSREALPDHPPTRKAPHRSPCLSPCCAVGDPPATPTFTALRAPSDVSSWRTATLPRHFTVSQGPGSSGTGHGRRPRERTADRGRQTRKRRPPSVPITRCYFGSSKWQSVSMMIPSFRESENWTTSRLTGG